ncbi:uncharacterized protein [Dermacentor albipictus]|uniref:uncharacterized protein n=1 Tax=Dermacentor albipictus TaxID=60249 RepID=UPI0038FC6A70
MGSSGAATAATFGRGNRFSNDEETDYQFILPQLPKGRIVNNTVFLHGDVRARPYKVEDFRDALAPTGLLPEVVCLGAYQVNHVWAVTLGDAAATKRLLALKEIQVKGRRCVIVDPQDQQVKLRLHWLLHGVEDEDVRTALAAFGKVVEVSREKWRVQGVAEKCSTTRTVLLKLKGGLKVEDIPHQIRVAGELALVVVPGRPMQCLRCQGTGHVRRDCKVPRCSRCRRFGHVDADCVKTYATATSPVASEEAAVHVMDAVETEDAVKGAGEQVPPEKTSTTTVPEVADAKVVQVAEQVTGPASVDKDKEPAKAGASEAERDDDESAMQQGEYADGGDRAAGLGASSKRPRDEAGDKNNAASSTSDGPPAKAPQGRRSAFKPKPNVPLERRPGDKVQQTNTTGKTGGPGGG